MLVLHSSVQVSYSQRLTLWASCPMNLRKFPLDSQYCALQIGSFGYTAGEVCSGHYCSDRAVLGRWCTAGRPSPTVSGRTWRWPSSTSPGPPTPRRCVSHCCTGLAMLLLDCEGGTDRQEGQDRLPQRLHRQPQFPLRAPDGILPFTGTIHGLKSTRWFF